MFVKPKALACGLLLSAAPLFAPSKQEEKPAAPSYLVSQVNPSRQKDAPELPPLLPEHPSNMRAEILEAVVPWHVAQESSDRQEGLPSTSIELIQQNGHNLVKNLSKLLTPEDRTFLKDHPDLKEKVADWIQKSQEFFQDSQKLARAHRAIAQLVKDFEGKKLSEEDELIYAYLGQKILEDVKNTLLKVSKSSTDNLNRQTNFLKSLRKYRSSRDFQRTNNLLDKLTQSDEANVKLVNELFLDILDPSIVKPATPDAHTVNLLDSVSDQTLHYMRMFEGRLQKFLEKYLEKTPKK